ncbi:hypothetical protein PVL29_026870 [Vitis rotundifolia]|uniref:Cytochrome P450 n=1 Tax=Vitis rotundifolia TaxID=103349 RepID=A0AA38YHK8_VITRO|nr:hypothetical protein PVL29_026870 [Vitis rotundifolia]
MFVINTTMEIKWLLLFAFNIFVLLRRMHPHLPPSPPAIPILGHLHLLLKPPIHRQLQNLSQKYGPIFSLRFGSGPVVIISSPSTIEECFTKNDIIFANRPRLLIGKYIGYNYTTIASASYGEHWRNLRRLSSLEIFSSNCVNMFLGIRRDEIKILLHRLSQNSRDNFARGLVNRNRMIDHLLSLQKSEPEYYTDEIIKGLALILIFAGTDTTATTIEWAMSLLLNHPDVLKKARAELGTHVGRIRLPQITISLKYHF